MGSTWKLDVKVVMCCNTCVEKVEDAVRGMHGVQDLKTDRWNDRLTIDESACRALDHKQLVRKLKSVTHEKKVKILESRLEEPAAAEEPEAPEKLEEDTVVYRGMPYIWPGIVPWVATDPFGPTLPANPWYWHHPVGCSTCMRRPGAVCANCGRRNALGAAGGQGEGEGEGA